MAINKADILQKIDAAMHDAALDAIEENKRFGLPMVYSRDGKIVSVDPEVAQNELKAMRAAVAK